MVHKMEQCVHSFWHDPRSKGDLRYLKVWLEYAGNCMDAEVVYSFLEANKIGLTQASFYIPYALRMESKNKIRTANEIFNRGISMSNSYGIQNDERGVPEISDPSWRMAKAVNWVIQWLTENESSHPIASEETVLH